jgi:6-phospho-beta-glucosidase
VASIKLVYIGGGSTRAPGTMASFLRQGQDFAGSEVVLVDLDPERLSIVEAVARNLARQAGADVRVRATTDRAAALEDCDAVLTSFRPGGFQARYLDESIPLRHGVIGQETQGPGGFFMALRSIAVMREIVQEMERVCPRAWLINYTNPINIVSQAVASISDIRVVSLCEGPIIFPRMAARAAGLDPDGIEAVMLGVNHGSWSVRQRYRGEEFIPLAQAAWEERGERTDLDPWRERRLWLTAAMESIPADYFQYYYFKDEILAELQAKPTTRSQDIMAEVPDYWAHYQELVAAPDPELVPSRSRGGINELELAIDVIGALFNRRDEVWPVNVVNGGAIGELPDDLVVEVPGRISGGCIEAVPSGSLPLQTRGLVEMLAEYQMLAADVGLYGNRRAGIRALAANPLVLSLQNATDIYDEMSRAHAEFLPERLLV